jgi:hypothetical protein
MDHKSKSSDPSVGNSPEASPTIKKRIARALRRMGLRPPLNIPEEGASASLREVVKHYSVPLLRKEWPTRAVLKLSCEPIGRSHGVGFGEHPVAVDGLATDQVIALHNTTVFQSDDLGITWESHRLEPDGTARYCFTTSTGCHLIATETTAQPGDTESCAVVRRYDAHWKPTGQPLRVRSSWHGSSSIGEANGVLMFAEYPVNKSKYGPAAHFPLADQLVSDPRVFRSRDDGRTWDVCFEVSATLIRHLHTVAPDPERPGRWWLTSGDQAAEVFIWRSDDDGDTWTDITADSVEAQLPESCSPRATQRLTDHAFHDGWMVWGSDDWLGNLNQVNKAVVPRAGSRVFKARADGAWRPQEVGFCGPPIRSMIDLGPAWIFISEAKARTVSLRPETFLVFKDELDRVHRFIQIDNWGDRPTGFTYSRASRKAKNGTFFTFRGGNDGFAQGPRLLRWEIEFF